MTNAELEKLIADSEAALRQAYALGRRDALDHVARWAQTEETTSTSTSLALVAPSEPAAPAPAAETAAPPPAVRPKPAPAAPSPRPRGFGALLLDYVYPSG